MNINSAPPNELPEGKILAAHVIAHAEPMTFQKQLDEFCKDKDVQSIDINTTPVMVGVMQGQGAHTASLQIITSAYVLWVCTKDEYNSFMFQQKTLIKN
jgi:hypothetical protein